MALVVEDGTGLADADSYVSQTDADDYVDKHGNESAWTGASSDDKDRALRVATAWIDGTYAGRWKGTRTYPTVQALAWPRVNVKDIEGYFLPSDELPVEIVTATIIVAVEHLSGSTPLNAANDGTLISREKSKAEDLEYDVTYLSAKSSEVESIPEIDRLLSRRGLLAIGAGEYPRG